MYNVFGEVVQPKNKKNKMSGDNNDEQFGEEQEIKQFKKRKTFSIQMDLYFYYAISTMICIVLTQEGQVNGARNLSLLTLAVCCFYDWIYTNGNIQLIEYFDFMGYFFPQSTYFERCYMIRISYSLLLNLIRSTTFVNDDKSSEKIYDDSSIIVKQYQFITQ